MEYHRSVAAQLMDSTKSLDCLFSDPGLQAKFQERAQQLQQMINDVRAIHRRLLLSADHWNQFQNFACQIDSWLKGASDQLQLLVTKFEKGRLSQEDCLQYWVCLHVILLQNSVNNYFEYLYRLSKPTPKKNSRNGNKPKHNWTGRLLWSRSRKKRNADDFLLKSISHGFNF